MGVSYRLLSWTMIPSERSRKSCVVSSCQQGEREASLYPRLYTLVARGYCPTLSIAPSCALEKSHACSVPANPRETCKRRLSPSVLHTRGSGYERQGSNTQDAYPTVSKSSERSCRAECPHKLGRPTLRPTRSSSRARIRHISYRPAQSCSKPCANDPHAPRAVARPSPAPPRSRTRQRNSPPHAPLGQPRFTSPPPWNQPKLTRNVYRSANCCSRTWPSEPAPTRPTSPEHRGSKPPAQQADTPTSSLRSPSEHPQQRWTRDRSRSRS